MTLKQTGLVGKFRAGIGNLVLLSNSEWVRTGKSESFRRASGFVKRYTDSTVTLSHEEPENYVGWSYPGRTFFSFTKGDRKYNLRAFTEYEVLIPNDPKSDSE